MPVVAIQGDKIRHVEMSQLDTYGNPTDDPNNSSHQGRIAETITWL